MTTRVLVPIDGSEVSDRALQQAITFANRSKDTVSLIVIHVNPDAPVYDATGITIDVDETIENEGKAIIQKAHEQLNEADVAYDLLLVGGDPVDEILRALEKHAAHYIVIGRRGRNPIAQLILGSVSERVLGESPVPVLVVR